MKIHIRTLGCKMNWLDSARLGAALQDAGHTLVDSETEADRVLVNSCTVTAEAERKSRQQARAALRAEKPVTVYGCGPRANPVQWHERLPEAPSFGVERELLRHFGVNPSQLPFPVASRTRLPVAIQTGCDDTCSFCITRIARGPHRSHPADKLVAHVREAHDLGIREIVVTGINLAAWGAEHSKRPEQARLHLLLERLLAETAIPRIRLSSLGPQYLHRELFEVLADRRVCDHLHLSVQSGSPTVLRRMDRGHDAEQVYRAAERARAARPDVALCADLIVGFPGETEAEFESTLTMVEDIGFAKLHVFPYSPREGTPAASMPGQIPGAEKKRRAACLRETGQRSRAEFLAGQLGKTRQVLVEGRGSGLTGNYIRLRTPGLVEGTLCEVRIQQERIVG
jgi:threonylcarbamoyladenosine tRNA methylthiotransferase MtaB